MEAMQISRSGMDVEWQRLEIVARNLANMNTTRTALGETYSPLRLVSGPSAGFGDYLDAARNGGAQGVRVYSLETSGEPPRRVHDPDHPHADEDGFVAYPRIDHAGEMVRMMSAARAYEANIVALGAARQMYSRAIELGRR
ncbi:MAG: flagellar basal body rod protein FlgC [Pseudomonadota bacterium]